MVEEKIDWKTFRTRETKEVIVEYDVSFIKDQLVHLKNEVNRLEDLLKLAEKAGINVDEPIIQPEPLIIKTEIL